MKITDPPKPIMTKLGRMCLGQIIIGRDHIMQRNPQRRLNSALPMSTLKVDALPAAPERAPVPGIARDGAAKVVADAPIHGNMQRQQKGEIGFHHGTVVEDEPNAVKTYTNPIPTHPGMVTQPTNDDRLRGKHDPAEAGRVLRDAQNLGRKA